MTNLWGVLLQTCSVSLVAGLLLGLKRVWKQTLSPRWQSALWGILAVRILFPVTMTGKFLLLPLPFWVETLKTVVEGHLSSSYTSFYEMTQVTAPVPSLQLRGGGDAAAVSSCLSPAALLSSAGASGIIGSPENRS